MKFVVSTEADVDKIASLLSGLKSWKPDDVQLMPEGIDVIALQSRSGWISDLCKQTGYRFSPRLHVMLYGNRRGT